MILVDQTQGSRHVSDDSREDCTITVIDGSVSSPLALAVTEIAEASATARWCRSVKVLIGEREHPAVTDTADLGLPGKHLVAATAVDLLVSRLTGRRHDGPAKVLLHYSLVMRESTTGVAAPT